MQNAECTLKNAKTLFLFVSVVLVASLPSLVFAVIQSAEVAPAPDLTLTQSDIVFSPENPVVGQPVNITAIVHNIGTATAKNVTVNFSVGGIPVKQRVIDELSPDSQKKTFQSTSSFFPLVITTSLWSWMQMTPY